MVNKTIYILEIEKEIYTYSIWQQSSYLHKQYDEQNRNRQKKHQHTRYGEQKRNISAHLAD
jgi:hypothetical protein